MPGLAVTATSFCQNQTLRESLVAALPRQKITFADPSQLHCREQLIAFLRGNDMALVGREKLGAAELASLPELRALIKYGVGLDNIELAFCEKHGIKVYSQQGVNADSVAEHTVGLMLALLRKIALSSQRLRQGVWLKDGGTDLRGKTVAIIGCGHIGSAVAKLLQGFQCPLLLCDVLDKSVLAKSLGASQVGFHEALAGADVISFHVPLTPETRGMVNADTLALIKPSAFLINTCRGEVVQQDVLREALKKGRLAGAASDVFAPEPLEDKGLAILDNFVGTAHTAASSHEAQIAMGMAAIRAAVAFCG